MLESPDPPPKWRSSFLDALEELVGGLSGTLEALEGHLGSVALGPEDPWF